MSGYIVNGVGFNVRPRKASGNTIINSISNSSCTTVHEVPAETIDSQLLFEKRLQQQSNSRSTLQGGTKLVDISSFSPGKTFDAVRYIKDRFGRLFVRGHQ